MSITICDFDRKQTFSYLHGMQNPAKDLKKTIAENLKKIRNNAGLTQKELGIKIGFKDEYAQSRIFQYESGLRSPSKELLTKLANILDVNVESFFIQQFKGIEPAKMTKGLAPLISWVRAGAMHVPIDNLQPGESEGHPIPTGCKDKNCFALRVKGNSMEPEFTEGDIIVVSPNIEVQSGNYAIIKYDGEITLKKFMRYPDAIILRPLNDTYKELVFRGDKMKGVKIIGKVVEKIKRY